MGSTHATRIRNVTAVLGPTNTGKTHLAIERMLDHETGVIGLPLRLLAREVYDKIVARVGVAKVALVTGEEKIKPDSPQYWVCTVEAMPQDVSAQFLAVDEIQLAADPERGHVFTDRLISARGDAETLVLGASTMREAIADLIPGANFISRPRLSKLTYAGQKKITRLPTRSAIVAFSASNVYAIAELIRRQRGGAAVVLGALSPRTRNAQVALYQSGDVDFLVATDAVGMGLNLDVDHVAFSAIRKFDGQKHRDLTPSELAQIAGRAGRHLSDGTFGVTGDVEPFETDLIERLESHLFEPTKTLQWRNSDLNFHSLDDLKESLRMLPKHQRLIRSRTADDVEALEQLSRDSDVLAKATTRDAVTKLWDVCQIPDYRKISSQNHAELVGTVYTYLMSPAGRIDDDWYAKQIEFSDRVDGDIDTLSNRLAHIRTWTFVANRPDWLADPPHLQERTREIEDNLSDALHTQLTQRFVDKRTSALMRGLKDKQNLTADIGEDGLIRVESHSVGRLTGFRYIPDTHGDGIHGKAARHAAAEVLSRELAMRARRVTAAKPEAFKFSRAAEVLWRGDVIARLTPGDDPLSPHVALVADEQLRGADRERVLNRVRQWVTDTIAERLKPLVDMAKADDITGLAKGIAFRLTEQLGVVRRESAADELKALDQSARSQLRKFGLRFGAFNVFFPVLLKPAAAELLLTLWCLKNGAEQGLELDNLPEAPRAGLTSVPADPNVPDLFYKVYGFHVCGPRAVRVDILERLADQIRPLLSWRPSNDDAVPPKGATGYGAFLVTPEMMSILGCSSSELGDVLRALGFTSERRTAPEKEANSLEHAGASGNGETDQPHSERANKNVSSEDTTRDDTTPEDTRVQNSDNEGESKDQAEVDNQAVQAAMGELTATANLTNTTKDRNGTSQADGSSKTDEAERSNESGETDKTDNTTESEGAKKPDGSDREKVTSLDGRANPDIPIQANNVLPIEHPGDNSADAAMQDSSDASKDDEEQFIEVWRPRRRVDPQHRDRRGRRGSGAARRTESSGDRRPRNSPTPASNRQAEAVKSEPAVDVGGDQAKQDGRRGSNRTKRKENRRKTGGDRRREDRGRPMVHTSSPKRSKGSSVDPDSPFAALSALRQAMDDNDRGSKSS
ncbi:MAG: helicase-related protein [Hyphomicrobiaceae bacterium]